MAWLHSWLGLLLGWFLFTIFLTGATSYYRHEINAWSQPTLANISVKQDIAIENAYNYLLENASDAKKWYVQIANNHNPINKVYWQTPEGKFEVKTLDPNTSLEMNLKESQLGEFFYLFHFQLYGLPIIIARLIVSFCAFIMLIALISGIITHKKIFADFFTLRAFKGQRSYLDFHNVSSVLALPFFLTVTFTGLAIFFYLYFPMGLNKTYPENKFQYFEEIRNVSTSSTPNLQEAKMLDFLNMKKIVQENIGTKDLAFLELSSPNTKDAKVSFRALEDKTITQNAEQVTFNAITGEILGTTKNQSAIAQLSSGVYGIHMATFAQPFLRIALYISGLLGCSMIASGLLLWSLKRQIQYKSESFHFGYYLVDRLNITALIGLPIAMICTLNSNRIIAINDFKFTEINVFFYTWLICFITSLFISKTLLWKSFLKIFIGASMFLLALEVYFLNSFMIKTSEFSYWNFLRVDIFIFIFILFAFFLHNRIEPITAKAHKKLIKKINAQKASESISS